jgi:hypothetical protein
MSSEQTIKELKDSFAEQFDDLKKVFMDRIKTLEGRSSNGDLSVEPEVTSAAKIYLEKIATKYNLKNTYKAGKNYVSNINEPTNSKKSITNLDGCYILTNSPKNAALQNSFKATITHDVTSIQSNITQMTKKINNPQTTPEVRNKLLKKLQIQTKAIQIGQNFQKIQKERQNKLQTLQSFSTSNESRFIGIVEAKFFLSKDYIDDQHDKMINLIRFFKATYLYYKSRDSGLLTKISMIKGWSKKFITLCEQKNLLFNGIIVVLGGPHKSKKIDEWFKDMQKAFYLQLDEEKELSLGRDELNNPSTDHNFMYKCENDFITSVKIEFGLLITNGNRYSEYEEVL